MTALRELAERWRATNRGETLYVEGKTAGMHMCAAELLAILDAEGDGGAADEAVAWQYRILDDEEGPSPYWHDMTHQQFEMFRAAARPRYELRQLYTHPARSGVVSDAMIAAYVAAVNEYLGNLTEAEWQSDRLDKHAHLARVARIGLTAALEHFAKGSSEDVRDAPELFSGTKDALSNLSIHKSYQEKTS